MLGSNCHIDETLAQLKALLKAVEDPLKDDWNPLTMGLLLAKLEYEDLDVETTEKNFLKLLDQELPEGLSGAQSLREQTEILVKIFNEKLGFLGDKSNYYNIKNSFLNDVLTRRKGIPISLSLVFMGMAQHFGMRAVGIGFPGHFLVRMVPSGGHFDVSSQRETFADWKEHWFIDCFDGGKIMTTRDCEKRLTEWTRGILPFGPEVLKVAHPVEIISRVLRNLRAILMEKEDLVRLYWVLTGLIELCPQDKVESIKDRGILLGRMGRYAQAGEDCREYLRLGQDTQKKAQIEGLLRFFENQRELPN